MHQLRILRVIAGTEYKLKYAESALGYVWSVAKPLAMFAVLYTVFGRFFKLNVGFAHYPLYLLIGIVIWNFFVDATNLAMPSLVARASLLRKLAFPHLVIPLSVTLSAAITLLVNLLVVGVFVGANGIAPQPDWLLFRSSSSSSSSSRSRSASSSRRRSCGCATSIRSGSSRPAPVLRVADHLPGRVPAAVGEADRVRQPGRAGDAGHPRDRHRRAAGRSRADVVYGTAWAYLVPDRLLRCSRSRFGLWLFRRESPWFAERV